MPRGIFRDRWFPECFRRSSYFISKTLQSRGTFLVLLSFDCKEHLHIEVRSCNVLGAPPMFITRTFAEDFSSQGLRFLEERFRPSRKSDSKRLPWMPVGILIWCHMMAIFEYGVRTSHFFWSSFWYTIPPWYWIQNNSDSWSILPP